MASIFCPSCGAKSEYQFSAPNFCSKCGKPYLESRIETFTSQMRTAKSKKQNFRQNEDTFDEVEDSDDNDGGDFSSATRVPRITRLDVEIDSSTDVRVIKFGDLVNQNGDSSFAKGKSLYLDDLRTPNDD